MVSKKSIEEKIKVMQAALEGKFINFTSKTGKTCVCTGEELAFNWTNFDYNIYEEPKTKPCINWEHVSKEYKYMATDCSGRTYLHIDEPTLKGTYWTTDPSYKPAEVISSYILGTCDWKDSLVKRPD